MRKRDSSIDAVTVASPCSVPWESMRGDDRRRHCEQCRLNVYDVARLTREEAEALLLRSEGRVCARLTRRADGTVVTRDCGRARAAIARRLRWVRAAAAAVLGAIGLGGCRAGADGAPGGWPGAGYVTTGVIAPPPEPPRPPEPPPPPPPPEPARPRAGASAR
jgi:hypothetical protein